MRASCVHACLVGFFLQVCLGQSVLYITALAERFSMKVPLTSLPCYQPGHALSILNNTGHSAVVIKSIEFDGHVITFPIEFGFTEIPEDFDFTVKNVNSTCTVEVMATFRPLDLSMIAHPASTAEGSARITTKPRTGLSHIEEIEEPSSWLVREACLTNSGFHFFVKSSDTFWQRVVHEWDNMIASLAHGDVAHDKEPATAMISTYVHMWNTIVPSHIRVQLHNTSMENFKSSRRHVKFFEKLYVLPPGSPYPYGHIIMDVAVPFSALAHDLGRPDDMPVVMSYTSLGRQLKGKLHELLAAGSPASMHGDQGMVWLQVHTVCAYMCVYVCVCVTVCVCMCESV
jgi:hypothetical protein